MSITFSRSGMIPCPNPSVRRIPRDSTASGKEPVTCGSQVIAGVDSLSWLKISRAGLLDRDAVEVVERSFGSDIDASETLWLESPPSPRRRFAGLIPRDEDDIALLFRIFARDWGLVGADDDDSGARETADIWSSQFSILSDDELDIGKKW